MIFALLARARPAPALRLTQQALFCWAGALLLVGDAVFWLMFAAIQSGSGLAAMDGPVHSLMVDSRSPAATALLACLTIVTSPEWLSVIGAVFALAWAVWKRELWRPAVLMGAMVLAVVATTLIKHAVGRSRPPSTDFLLGPDDALSFPSGHTVGIGVFTVVLAYLLLSRTGTRTTAVLGFSGAFALTALVGLSRLYLGYHWLTDVVASCGVALAVAAVAVFVDAARHGSSRLRPRARSGMRPHTGAGRTPDSVAAAGASAPDTQA